MTISEKFHRPIRSYVLRQGRMTSAQQHALAHYWPLYGLSLTQQPINFASIFGREAKRTLEIGFGMGDSLVALAQQSPAEDFLGIEVHQPGVGKCLDTAQALGLSNLKIIADDAVMVLQQHIPAHSIDKILLLFPDPWPKTKHHKRRIVQAPFVQLIAQKLKPNGIFHLATDWQDYADHMMAVLEESVVLKNKFGPNQFAPHSCERLSTKFERRGQKLGHPIWDLLFTPSGL